SLQSLNAEIGCSPSSLLPEEDCPESVDVVSRTVLSFIKKTPAPIDHLYIIAQHAGNYSFFSLIACQGGCDKSEPAMLQAQLFAVLFRNNFLRPQIFTGCQKKTEMMPFFGRCSCLLKH
ncbi:MAG TPA: hypothetical protein DCG57_12525, partial [Candidatus Riflebacteria bacterium]|nr:hypothetical protein [Candidatus Riflebacteria bacterium]